MKSMYLREITHQEFMTLQPDDIIYLKVDEIIYESKVIRSPFYNSDSDEHEWEIETSNGFCDEYSILIRVN